MKKLLAFLLAFMLAFTPMTGVSAYAVDNTISVTVDGQVVTFNGTEPVVIDGRTLVPLRGVFEKLGFEVIWEKSDKMAILMNDDYVVSVVIGDDFFIVNGKEHTIDVPAQIINGSVMVPLRVILENIGYSLSWDGTTNTILIKQLPEDDGKTVYSLVGQWEMNCEATTDALLPHFAGTGVTRAILYDEISKIETIYHFNENGTGKVISEDFGNGTLTWSSDGKKLKINFTLDTGKTNKLTLAYKVSSNRLTFYAVDNEKKVAQVFRRVTP